LEQRLQRIEKLSSLLGASLEQKFTYAQELANQFTQNRRIAVEITEVWLAWWRDLMLIKGGCQEAVMNVDFEATLAEQARGLSLGEIEGFLEALCLLQEGISKNVNPRLAWERLLLNLPEKKLSAKP
jgi:DNA polymerase-3 subunit delta'